MHRHHHLSSQRPAKLSLAPHPQQPSLREPNKYVTAAFALLKTLTAHLTDQLPALSHEGVWTSGFAPIVRYLTSKSLCADLDAALSPSQRADLTAYRAYLGAHAAPLLDLSLYVSAANWAATTRPAYSQLLRWPLTWTIPPLVRAEATKGADHLGLAELDNDFDPSGGLHLSAGRDALPETFRKHIPISMQRKTVREEMTPEQATAIRLVGLTEDCLSTIEGFTEGSDEPDEVSEKPVRFFEGDSITSLDCLAFGYLSLMRDAPVPRSFLKDWLLEKAPRLSRFVDEIKSIGIKARGGLPWVERPLTALGLVSRILGSTLRNMPTLGKYYENELRVRAEQGGRFLNRRTWTMLLTFVVTTASLGYGFHSHRAMQPFGKRLQVFRPPGGGSKLAEFGEIGAMLGNLPPQGLGGYSNVSEGGRFVETTTETN